MFRRNLNVLNISCVVTFLVVGFSAGVSSATVVPFTEGFSADSANWTDNASAPANWNAAGSFDGSAFVSSSFNFSGSAANDPAILFRGQQAANPVDSASGGAFVGDWISDGVTEVSFLIRHNAGVPLGFFSRFTPASPPVGAIGLSFIPVPSDTWVPITLAVDASNTAIVYEAGNFSSVFDGIGNVQVGVSAPAGLAGIDQVITFDLDNISIVPEPATLLLLTGGAMMLVRRRIRKAA